MHWVHVTRLHYMANMDRSRPGRHVCQQCYDYYMNKTTTQRRNTGNVLLASALTQLQFTCLQICLLHLPQLFFRLLIRWRQIAVEGQVQSRSYTEPKFNSMLQMHNEMVSEH